MKLMIAFLLILTSLAVVPEVNAQSQHNPDPRWLICKEEPGGYAFDCVPEECVIPVVEPNCINDYGGCGLFIPVEGTHCGHRWVMQTIAPGCDGDVWWTSEIITGNKIQWINCFLAYWVDI